MALRLRFPKSARLTESGEYSRVRKEGRSYHGRFMIMGVYRDRATTRFGLITSRRVGNAVVRNRLRRRLREMIRLSQPRIVPGLWIVLVVRATAARASGDSLRSEYIALGNRAAIFIES
jgi:ribonuclease P protein component